MSGGRYGFYALVFNLQQKIAENRQKFPDFLIHINFI